MSDLNNNTKTFNLPAYINIPFFLYQDNRLEKSATMLAGFFQSIHSSGQKITASTDYLCAVAGIHKRQLYKILNQLEECNYIKRTGFTNRKKIHWIYEPKSSITIIENDTSALLDTSVQELNTSALDDTKLVHSRTLNLCTPVHTDIKEDTKDNKKLTTVDQDPSSSSFFSQKQKDELLTFKLKSDERNNELFLQNCSYHVEKQKNDLSKFQRFTGLKHILTKLYETGEYFKASGFDKSLYENHMEIKIPSPLDFMQYKKCVNGYEWVGAWMQKQKNG